MCCRGSSAQPASWIPAFAGKAERRMGRPDYWGFFSRMTKKPSRPARRGVSFAK